VTEPLYDLAIIGGGVNGCGIARDAAGRGASVVLFEQNDLGSGTSSASTKLIHGGLRYLEHYEFRLVREALMEREVLWRLAPHIVWPLRFVLPHDVGLRPAWLLRIGLFLYDHLGGRKLLPPTRSLDLRSDPAGAPLKERFRRAFEYSDCWVEDSRLVVLNARDAADRGASIQPRTRVLSAERGADAWRVEAQGEDGARQSVHAKVLVNAAGPWVGSVLTDVLRLEAPAPVRLVQGSHVVVRRLHEHDRCYIFQNADGRIVFAIPYQSDFTLIGTTDLDYQGDPADVKITADEIAYLCSSVSEYFAKPVLAEDVVWTYSGVRPLYDDGANEAKAATRDYVFELDLPGGAPLLSIYGGKITTYRRLAEEALQKLAPYLKGTKAKEGWTAHAALPGGDFDVSSLDALIAEVKRDYPFLTGAHASRLVHAYGTRAARLLGNAASAADLGRDFGATLTEREVRYLIANEWAVSAEDIVWRRSKLGLRLSGEEIVALEEWLLAHRDHVSSSPQGARA
jgi:glycerol-3-phosphate dehydrogenase